MTTWTRLVLLAAILAVAVVTASCSNVSDSSPSPTACDEVSSEMGGCTTERHEFVGTTCDAVATEWGGVMDRLVLAVINGPESVNNEARSSRLRQVIGIAAIDMDQHLEFARPTRLLRPRGGPRNRRTGLLRRASCRRRGSDVRWQSRRAL